MHNGKRLEPQHAYGLMDVARAIAAILVSVSHIRDLFLVNYAGQGGLTRIFYLVTGFGHAAVVVFFVLSGFWITRSVVQRANAPNFWSNYLINRISRLWIVLLPALVLGGFLDWLGKDLVQSSLYSGTSGAASLTSQIDLSALVFTANVFFLQTIVAPVFGSNGPLWSLSSEFWFYMWFPALWLTFILRRPSPLLISLLLGFINPGLLIGFLSWLCGSLLYWLVEQLKERQFNHPFISKLILLTGAGAVLTMLGVVRLYPTWWIDPLLAFSFAWFLFGLCLVNPPVPWLRRLATYGAERSFSLYVIHYPVAALAAACIVNSNRLPPTGEAIGLVLVVLILVIAMSFVFAAFTEGNTSSLRQWLLRWTARGDRQVRPSLGPRADEL